MNAPIPLSPLLVQPHGKREAISRQMAELALGVVAALRSSSITREQARQDLFNLDNYLRAKKLRLHPNLLEAFEWAMELEDVAELTPRDLEKSYRRIVTLLMGCLQPRPASPNGARTPRLRVSAAATRLTDKLIAQNKGFKELLSKRKGEPRMSTKEMIERLS